MCSNQMATRICRPAPLACGQLATCHLGAQRTRTPSSQSHAGAGFFLFFAEKLPRPFSNLSSLVMLLVVPSLLLGLVLHPSLAPQRLTAPGRGRCAVLQQPDDDSMPELLGDWGCDAELWAKIRGAKGSLRKLARLGDEAQGRKRIASIRTLVEQEEADPAAAAAKAAERRAALDTPKAKKESTVLTKEERASQFSNPRAATAAGAKPLKAGYELKGELPAGYDAAPVVALVNERVAAKIARDFAKADALQEQLVGMGVRLDDRRRTWSPPDAA